MARLLTIRGHARWGYLRLKGELRKLGFEVSASTIRRVLRHHRIPPALRRSALTWRRFLAAHASTIVATNFFAVDTVFLKRFYMLFFIHLESRRILSQTVDGDVAFLTYERIEAPSLSLAGVGRRQRSQKLAAAPRPACIGRSGHDPGHTQ